MARGGTQVKYFLDQDDDCHWYLIPLSEQVAWDKWCNSGFPDGEFYEKTIKWMINNPKDIVFENPEELK